MWCINSLCSIVILFLFIFFLCYSLTFFLKLALQRHILDALFSFFHTRLLLSTMSFSINVQLFQTHKVPSKSGNKLKLSTSGYITFIHPLKTFFIHRAMSASVCGYYYVIYPPCFFSCFDKRESSEGGVCSLQRNSSFFHFSLFIANRISACAPISTNARRLNSKSHSLLWHFACPLIDPP